ncbi:MAG: HlyD family efflux transporter periplasmic adaptor subunit [Rhodocyclaceae bacterium]|nr:HlyD family efflux transporter periplasmic adaptor subunit [Rhodocyclaceae bacterium]MBX3669801.1 HlyD family efflux transporter periplasmic adaptor subunit [Rhodocyclaceae bacterium]
MCAMTLGGPAPGAVLPPLRQELGLFEAPADAGGAPAWNLHDPAANRFYRISWAAFEILSRWHLGSADAIAASLQAETTLDLGAEDVTGVLEFLSRHHLLECRSAADSQRLAKTRAAERMHWSRWLLKNYLFFRIPLLRPDTQVAWLAARLGGLFRSGFWYAAAGLLLMALFLLLRQWDSFTHTFAAWHNWEALAAFAVALSASKVVHELGHAVAARHHGCRVPSMGVAFLVLWPVLYTDTTEAWKLASRRARLAIGAAGMAAEMLLAIAATYAWLLLPDGAARSAAFFLASTTWLITLAINASPFMRFDGYFLLSDLLGVPNLHARAFALGRWWLREKLFGLGLACPEALPPRRRRLLIAFAAATWIYRLVLFLTIAVMVYYLFFKALGIVLMAVEVGWFVLRPLAAEFSVWRALRPAMRWNWASRRSLGLLVLLLAWLLVPWPTDLGAPAVLAPVREQTLYSPFPAQVVSVAPRSGNGVRAGEILAELESPELERRMAGARQTEAALRWQLEQQALSASLQQQGEALRHHWAEAGAQLKGLTEERDKLSVRAPFDGAILARNDELAPGTWLAAKEMLFAVADRSKAVADAYVNESDLERIQPGGQASFVPDAAEFGRYDCRIAEIDRVNVAQLEDVELASSFGGALATRPNPHPDRNALQAERPALEPAASIYRVRLAGCAPELAPALRLRGTAQLAASGQSLLVSGLRHVLRVLAREAGF